MGTMRLVGRSLLISAWDESDKGIGTDLRSGTRFPREDRVCGCTY